jgi:hypothetical protein
MKTTYPLFIIVSLLLIAILGGCSTIPRYDDAVRIRKDSAYKYEVYPFNPSIVRSGNTLRGTVIKMETYLVPDTCPISEQTKYKATNRMVFLDTRSPNLNYVEYIPFEDIDFIGPKFGEPVNAFEDFNFPLEPKKFRYVPWDTVIQECVDCGCTPFTLAFRLPTVQCPTRYCNWYFLEIRGGYTTFSDKIEATRTIWSDAFFGEIAGGIRFGNQRQFGIGLMVSTGVPIYNQFTSKQVRRPLALIHFRWDPFRNCVKRVLSVTERKEKLIKDCQELLGLEAETKEWKEDLTPTFKTCISPYFFVQAGLPFDIASIDLVKFNLNPSCKDKIRGAAPYLDIDYLPITLTIGAGLDFPIGSYLDFSIDAGFRSYAFGETQTILGYSNVPSYRRINMFFIRTGITF